LALRRGQVQGTLHASPTLPAPAGLDQASGEKPERAFFQSGGKGRVPDDENYDDVRNSETRIVICWDFCQSRHHERRGAKTCDVGQGIAGSEGSYLFSGTYFSADQTPAEEKSISSVLR